MKKLVKYLIAVVVFSNLLVSTLQAKEYTIDQLPVLKQESTHQVVARRVTNFFTQSHYRNFNLDDEFSKKIFDRYLKLLDYNKSLFIQADIDKFTGLSGGLGNELRSGEVDTAYAIYQLSLQKRFLRYQYALELLKQPMNFDADETVNFKREDIPWAKTEQELDTFWRQRVKFDEINLALTGKTEDEIRDTLSKRYTRMLRSAIQTNSEDVFQVFMNAFAREIDPHTSYLAPRNKRDFDSEMSLSFEGIGATLSQEDDYTSIVSFVAGGPAEKSKQMAIGDKIIGVGTKGKPVEDVIGWRLDDVVDLIRGPKGSIVQLEILPAGKNSKPKIVDIIRDTIRFEDREAKSSVVKTERGSVGVIEIPSFYIGLTDKVKALVEALNKDQVVSIVIDLRNDGGGSLAEVISLTGLFIEQGPVVQVRDNVQNIVQYKDKDPVLEYSGPIVVMVNRYSASASEIFAAAMQDYGRAVIVGETTYGKGTVQTSRNIAYPIDAKLHPDWPALGGVQYTVQKFYRINGGSTQLKGVTPDIAMNDIEYTDETGERFMDNALPWDSIPAAPYDKIRELAPVIPELLKLHTERVSHNQEFIYLDEDINRYNRLKDNQTMISLNKVKRETEQKENDDRELTRTNDRLKRMGLPLIDNLDKLPKDYKAPDPYLDEAVEIALDLKTRYPTIVPKGAAPGALNDRLLEYSK